MEEMCPDIPVLERLMADIGGLAESGARYTEMPHVIEITLPMLCSYLPRWWERGPEAPPPALPAGAPPPCTAVTSDHLNSLLGNILRIIVNNLGIDEATWMKRLAGGSGERAGPETGASVLGLGSLDLRGRFQGLWFSVNGEESDLGFLRSTRPEIIPRSQNLRVIESERDAWILGIFQAGFGISGALERIRS